MDLLQFGMNLVIIVRFMRERAIRAVLDFLRHARILEVSTALVTQRIKWAITKQAVELFGIALLMAWKIGALDVSEKFVTIVHKTPPASGKFAHLWNGFSQFFTSGFH